MKIYLTEQDVICDLHAKGFIYDFQIAGNDLLWVQEQVFVRAGDFAIKEYHQFNDRSQKGSGIIVLGVVALYHNVKGILLRHYSSHSLKTPPVVLKKLKDLFINSSQSVLNQII
jgi:hypothetical protein